MGLCGELSTITRVLGFSSRGRASGVELPAVGFARFPLRHVRAGGFGDGIQRLVRGPVGDDVIAGPDDLVEERKDRLFGAGERDDVVGGSLLVDGRDRRAELGRADGVDVAQAQLQQAFARIRFQREHFVDGERLGIRRAGEQADAELVLGEEPFERERPHPHSTGPFSSRCGRSISSVVTSRFAAIAAPAPSSAASTSACDPQIVK